MLLLRRRLVRAGAALIAVASASGLLGLSAAPAHAAVKPPAPISILPSKGTFTGELTILFSTPGAAADDHVFWVVENWGLFEEATQLSSDLWAVTIDTAVYPKNGPFRILADLDAGDYTRLGEAKPVVIRFQNPIMHVTQKTQTEGKQMTVRGSGLPGPGTATAYVCGYGAFHDYQTPDDIAAFCDPATAVSKSYPHSSVTISMTVPATVQDPSQGEVNCHQDGCVLVFQTGAVIRWQFLRIYPPH